LGYAVAAAGLLAMCCIVTIHVNDETIRAEAAVNNEDSGMLFEHEQHDSDDLSESERQLIAAAGDDDDDDEVPEQKFSELSNAQNHADRARKGEDSEDDLTSDEQIMIHAANKLKNDDTPLKKAPVSAKKFAAKSQPQPVSDIATEFKSEQLRDVAHKDHEDSSADKDGLTAEDRALISAANNNDVKKLAKKKVVKQVRKAVPHLHAKRVHNLKAQVMASIQHSLKKQKAKKTPAHFHKKAWGEMNEGERKLRTTDDDLSPEMRSLIAAASHEDPHNLQRAKMQLGPNLEAIEEHLDSRPLAQKQMMPRAGAVDEKAIMRKAMEKITKVAAQKAVFAATTTMPELHAATVAHAQSARQAAPVSATIKPNMSLRDARSIVYGMSSHPMHAATHFDEEQHDDKEDHTSTLKSVEDMRHEEQLKLRAKFQQMEASSSKVSEDSWQRKLEAADKKAAKMAIHKALPLTRMEIARASLMRRNLAAQYRANDAFKGDLDLEATITGAQ